MMPRSAHARWTALLFHEVALGKKMQPVAPGGVQSWSGPVSKGDVGVRRWGTVLVGAGLKESLSPSPQGTAESEAAREGQRVAPSHSSWAGAQAPPTCPSSPWAGATNTSSPQGISSKNF